MAVTQEGSEWQGKVREKRKKKSPVERAGACIRPSYCLWRVVRRVGIGMGAQRLSRTPR